jgi:hypothetical protein
MRHFGRFFFALCGILLFVCNAAHPQQPWSSILNSSRAIDWSHAGLPAKFPDGETTPNPWTPPTRPACNSAQAGLTVPVASGTAFGIDGTQSNTVLWAMKNCASANPGGSYLQLAAGSFTVSSTAYLSNAPYTTLRGSGPMSTTITSNSAIQFGSSGGNGGGTLNASPSAGATSVTLTGVSGATPTVGTLAWFNQCDTGWSGVTQPTSGYNSCTSGSYSDNGAIFVCGGTTTCNSNGSGSGAGGQTSQEQFVTITSVTNNGGGSYTIGFSPGLYLPNWSTARTASMYWQPSSIGNGIGLEDMTIVFNGSGGQVQLLDSYASWVKGVRFIGATNGLYEIAYSKNALFVNNYLFGATPSSMSTVSQIGSARFASDNLLLNNIAEEGGFLEGQGSLTGDVYAYNYSKNVSTPYVQATDYQHDNWSSGVAFVLNEGNQVNSIIDDDTWGTGNLNTFFRNWVSCDEEPYVYSGISGSGIAVDAYHRFDNAVGNVIGGTPQCNTYSSSSNGSAFRINYQNTDSLAGTTLLRWYNYDTINGNTRCQSSEVPTSLSGNAVPFENAVPGSCSAPASFYMNSITSHPSGGTGLSWWKVCTNWTTFPTSCAGSTTEPFPSAGPDVKGGDYINGYAYDNPAHLAWRTLPIDTSYQKPYSITGSSWSGGIETLTVSGLPGSNQATMGPFQISGGACATSGAGTATGAEVQMTGSTTATVSYALASNPGTCTGTMLWPDVRQFDERVYQNDLSQSAQSGPGAPINLTGTLIQ